MPAATKEPSAEAVAPQQLRGPPRRRPREGWRRARRVALMAAGLSLIVVLASYLHMLAQPSNSSVGIRTVEWLRENGARGIVNQVESIYYSFNAPLTGGPALRALPKLPGSIAAVNAAKPNAVHYYRPRQIRPLIHPALPGEGVWRATFARGGSRPPVLVTTFRSDPAYPQMVAGVAWIDHTETST